MDKNELEKLRQRVAAGNEKLNLAWLEINKIEDEKQQKEKRAAWDEAVLKLRGLCNELNKSGCFSCLYPAQRCFDWPEGLCCLVCPDLFWINPNEKVKNTAPKIISDQAIEQVKQVRDNPELKKFLAELGGLI